MRKTQVLLAALIVAVSLTGCSALTELGLADPPIANDPAAVDSNPAAADPAPPQPAWLCVYDPTYDDDWHNDVSCSNGVDSQRPYLLPDDSYITQDEIVDAAAQFEAQLNAVP